MTKAMSELALSPQVFAILSALIEERIGLSYSVEERSLLQSKVSGRALEAGFESILDYYYYLRYDDQSGDEFQALAESLVVHETYFFRELDALQVMISEFVLPSIQAGRKPRIWSAACATGEEPLTVAILLAELGLLERVELLATDVSEAALGTAQRPKRSRRALRQIPRGIDLERWFDVQDEHVSLRADLQRSIRWQALNLLDDTAVARVAQVDVVLCRNVLIYFREETVARVVARLCDRLVPGGVFMVGVSESLMRLGTGLSCEEHQGVFVYRKPGQSP
jgi:chemotaxis protein methyltransferase CheR